MICGGAYTERDLIHLRATNDYSTGWALTKDAVCLGGNFEFRHAGYTRKKFFYRDIATVNVDPCFLVIIDKDGRDWNLGIFCDTAILNDTIKRQLVNFLNGVKD